MVHCLSPLRRFHQSSSTARLAGGLATVSAFLLTVHVYNGQESKKDISLNCLKVFQAGSLDVKSSGAAAVWRPNGCSMRYRSINESVECMMELTDKNLNAPYIVFAGDSRPRQLRDGMVLALTGQDYDRIANPRAVVNEAVYKKHEAHVEYYRTARAHVRFEWITNLDNGTGAMTQFLQKIITSDFKPNLLVLGVGVHRIRECHRAKPQLSQQYCAQEYKEQFLKMLPLLQEIANSTLILWTPQTYVNENLLGPPGDVDAGFTNENMILYNRMITEALLTLPGSSRSPLTYWHSALQASIELNDGLDGLHLGFQTKHHLIQMLINWMCSSLGGEREILKRYRNLMSGTLSENYCCE
ncbi:hypothetical protein BV898_15905 [Hypsibius exemplaris]|uniref:CAS1 domain-containing protein 1 n=1 Tax=Hypsibius exemplaris TaxID=2072580 RepID=A0A9X6NC62_HYPEX|nr:hypothetical protein BV898_15905 [Hypsibius exemplaris]